MDLKKQDTTGLFSMQKIHKVLSTYSEKSSVSGLSFIIGSKYRLVRVLWALLLLFAVVALTTHLILLFVEYYEYDKHTVTSLNFSVLPFPAVTFCNVNPIRMSKIHLVTPELQKLINAYNPKTLIEREVQMYAHGDQSTDSTNSDQSDPHEYSSHHYNDHLDQEMGAMGDEFDIDSFLNSGWDKRGAGTNHQGHKEVKTVHSGPLIDGQRVDMKEGEEYAWDRHTSVSTFSKIMEAFRILFAHQDLPVRQEIGHSLNDLLIHCSFAGRHCKSSDFTQVYSNHYGNCYTLKYENRLVTKDGPLSGLQLILYLQGEDRIRGFSNSRGAQIVIHEPGSVPSPHDEGFTVSAGTHSMIGLRMHDITRLGEPYGKCVSQEMEDKHWKPDFNNVSYTRQMCQRVCEMSTIIQECGCIDPSYTTLLSSLFNVTSTDLFLPCRTDEERRCARRTQGDSVTIREQQCTCLNPCREKKYITAVSSRLWPDEDYAAIFVNSVCRKHKEKVDECEALKKKKKLSLREEFVKLSIYYEDLNYEKLKEVPKYRLVNLLSDIGGTIGLWLGLSLLSLLEIVHLVSSFLFTTCLAGCKRHFKKKDKKDKLREESVIDPTTPLQTVT